MKYILAMVWLIFLLGNTFAQNITTLQIGTGIEERIKKDMYVLSSDSMRGREAGTKYEIAARDYIVHHYKSLGIKPAFNNNSYIQPFTFISAPTYGDSNMVIIQHQTLKLKYDFYPLSYSSNGSVKGKTVNVGYGIVLPEKKYNDYNGLKNLSGKIFIIDCSLPSTLENDSTIIEKTTLQQRIDTAISKDASGIIFICSDTMLRPSAVLNRYISPCCIPVIYINENNVPSIKDQYSYMAEIKVNMVCPTKTAYNIGAFIDNHAPYTIVLGAHYDHLGVRNEYSLRVNTTDSIYNGADDNASGTVAVMELSRYLNSAVSKHYNYLFLHFSAEEEGTIGSIYFTNSQVFDMSLINYMLNFDMIGRYDTSKIGLNIMGTGTSPIWDTLIESIPHANLKLAKTKSGLEGSDQLSFYVKNIPVLFFFTGIHADYHHPSDEAYKINFPGEANIIAFAEKLIEQTDTMSKLSFTKLNQSASSIRRTSLKVTLGVIPDHSYDGKGMKIESVMDGRPASNAGLQAGDIIIQIGDATVSDITAYMKILSHYKKGDKTKVNFKRGKEAIVREIQF